MDPIERLQQVGLFTDLTTEDLARICADVTEVRLEAGEVLFEEGDAGDRAYVVAEGTIEIVKATQGREALLAVRGPSTVIGEMALLQKEPRNATVRARTPVELLAISKNTLDQLLESSPSAARAMFQALLQRMRQTSDRLRHSERMAQLGTLTAGVAHELNNPAAAVRRSAQRLREEVDALLALAAEPPPADDGRARRSVLDLLSERAASRVDETDALARSDTEAAVEDWLGRRAVEDPWRLAPQLVDAGIDSAVLDRLGEEFHGAALDDAMRFLVLAGTLHDLVSEAGEGAQRLSDIVGAMKGYSYLDQAPVQEVDIVKGLEDTLVLLAHKTKQVRVRKEFDPDLPKITASGSELNQVWTNLIDNACDALDEVTDRAPTLTLRAYPRDRDVVVEVEDNGPGIPEDVRDKIFDAFFTTKQPGKGTGLGLQLTYQIVTLEHRGELSVDTEPGRTTFRVVLPISPDDEDASDQEATAMADTTCEHLETVEDTPKPEGGCQACLEQGDTWVHLRFCTTCETVGCCDDSKNRHARRHAESTGHPVIRSKEPNENWAWCIPDEVGKLMG